MTNLVMKQKKLEFSQAAMDMKAMFICQLDLENVIQLTSNFHKQHI